MPYHHMQVDIEQVLQNIRRILPDRDPVEVCTQSAVCVCARACVCACVRACVRVCVCVCYLHLGSTSNPLCSLLLLAHLTRPARTPVQT
jgi:hypothetical protein